MAERTILFATDYSDASKHALPFACSLARDLDALLVIAHVSEHDPCSVGEACEEDPQPNALDLETLRKVQPLGQDIRYEHRVLYAKPSSQTARPADEILRHADASGAYAIVVGTHGRTGISRALMGSTAEALMRHANCPVVTVRCPGKFETPSPES